MQPGISFNRKSSRRARVSECLDVISQRVGRTLFANPDFSWLNGETAVHGGDGRGLPAALVPCCDAADICLGLTTSTACGKRRVSGSQVIQQASQKWSREHVFDVKMKLVLVPDPRTSSAASRLPIWRSCPGQTSCA